MRLRFNDSTGDHLTLLNVYEEWVADGRSKDWCFSHFIHFRAIRNAAKVREQLVDIMRRLKLPLVHCPVVKKSRRIDPLPILRSLATAFYVHTAKRHPQRPYFYPYLSSISQESSSSQNIMALYTSPQSALSSHMTDSPPDWVIYNDIQYVSKAQMRTVSRIDFEMVRVLLGRVKLMDVEKLTGTHVEGGKPNWADDDVGRSSQESSVTVTKDASLEFEQVHEVIDEQHHTELVHIGDKDVPLESHKKDVAVANHEAEERERERKRAEYRERFLKRKR
jgi:hypothetical protein